MHGCCLLLLQPPHLRRPPKKRVSEYIQYLIELINSVSTCCVSVHRLDGGCEIGVVIIFTK